MTQIDIQKSGRKNTLEKAVVITGPAPFTAECVVKMTISPWEGGRRFVIDDAAGRVVIPVDGRHTKQAGDDEHTSLLANSKGEVRAVEHILSALTGLEIDSCEIKLEGGNQVPALDASAKGFTKLLSDNTRATKVERLIAVVKEPIYFTHGTSMAIIRPYPKKVVSALIQFEDPVGEQFFQVELTPENYLREICWARSFVRRSCDDEVWKICRSILPALPEDIRKSPVLVFREGKWIVKSKPLEPVRHKILDAIGDLSILGVPVVGHMTLIRPGHNFNRELVNHLAGLLDEKVF